MNCYCDKEVVLAVAVLLSLQAFQFPDLLKLIMCQSEITIRLADKIKIFFISYKQRM